jgi:hypothetical protein
VTIPLPADPGGVLPAGRSETAQITIQNFPFLMKRIGHAILGPNGVVQPGILALADVSQDGQYTIRFRTDERNYMNEPLSALGAFGGGQFSQIVDLPAPIELDPKVTIAVDVATTIERQQGINIQVIFEGVEPYEAAPPGSK